MNTFSSDKIRNVCLMGHGGAGKTTFAEAMLFNAKASDRFGKVSDGTTATDYDAEEVKRQISINLALAPYEWKNAKINIIDCPGFFDFVGEVKAGIRVADAAVILVSGRSGVSVGTEHSWKYAKENHVPVAFFVNKMDDPEANFNKTLESLTSHFGTTIAPFEAPVIEGGKLVGIVDIITGKAYKFDGGAAVEIPVPADMASEIEETKGVLMEAIAETDEALMEKYFGGEEFTVDEINKAVRSSFKEGNIVPVFCGSASSNISVQPVMDAIAGFFPAPTDSGDVKADASAPLSALVFKTVADSYGKLSIFRVYSGKMTANSTVFNASTGKEEKIGRLCMLRGKKQVEVAELVAGDIGAVTKLASTVTGNTLCAAGKSDLLPGINFPKPALSLAIVPKVKGEEEKVSSGLRNLEDEDPSFKVSNNKETHQMIISGVGEQQLDVIVSKLKTKFGVEVNLIEPRVPYRETIRKSVKVQGRHKKQSGGHGQFGDVWIEFSPHDGDDLIFEENVFGGAVPKNYFPAVEKGLRDCISKGILAGYPVVGLKAVLVDGSYHPVDSSEMAFKIAASLAYKDGLPKAAPVLLEPIGKLTVNIPDSYMGDIVGDINKRRGRINTMGGGVVEAEVPMSEMSRYATDLRSMTQARGSFDLEFVRYEDAPANVAQSVIEKAKADQAE